MYGCKKIHLQTGLLWNRRNQNADFSGAVSEDIKAEVKRATNEILAGQDVFSGVIYDNEGNLRCKENQAIRDELLLEQFDWYAEGVEFYEE